MNDNMTKDQKQLHKALKKHKQANKLIEHLLVKIKQNLDEHYHVNDKLTIKHKKLTDSNNRLKETISAIDDFEKSGNITDLIRHQSEAQTQLYDLR